jgi:hypothetical protein
VCKRVQGFKAPGQHSKTQSQKNQSKANKQKMINIKLRIEVTDREGEKNEIWKGHTGTLNYFWNALFP